MARPCGKPRRDLLASTAQLDFGRPVDRSVDKIRSKRPHTMHPSRALKFIGTFAGIFFLPDQRIQYPCGFLTYLRFLSNLGPAPQALVRRSYEPGMSVSLVARQEGVAVSLLFQWRKLEQEALAAVSAGEAVVPASEVAAARAEIAKLQRVLGKKTLENEILKEAAEYAADKR